MYFGLKSATAVRSITRILQFTCGTKIFAGQDVLQVIQRKRVGHMRVLKRWNRLKEFLEKEFEAVKWSMLHTIMVADKQQRKEFCVDITADLK